MKRLVTNWRSTPCKRKRRGPKSPPEDWSPRNEGHSQLWPQPAVWPGRHPEPFWASPSLGTRRHQTVSPFGVSSSYNPCVFLSDSLSWLFRKSVGMEKTPTQPGDRGRERQVAGSGETHRKPRGGQHGAGPSAWAEGPRDPRLRPAATPGSAAGARNRQTDVQRPRATLGKLSEGWARKPAVPLLLGQVSAERRAPLAMERGAQSAFRSEGLPPS